MSNMSYCRFENTARDLDDCQAALEELISEGGPALSREELEAAKRLVLTCFNIAALVAEASNPEMANAIDELLDNEKDIDICLDNCNKAARKR